MTTPEITSKAQHTLFSLSNYTSRWKVKSEGENAILVVKSPEMRFYVTREEINTVTSHFADNGFLVSRLSVEDMSYQLKINKTQ